MTDLKNRAMEIVDQRYCEETPIEDRDYHVICGALEEIEPLCDRDKILEDLWAQFGDVPMNPETECIEEPFLGFPAGTNREELWRWFDERHSKGVAYLLYRDGIDRTDQFSKMVYLKQLCFECESKDCCFNHNGDCRFAMVHGCRPIVTDEDGCTCYCYSVSASKGGERA